MPTTDPTTLTGQVVLITGGSRGIGRAIALRLARQKPAHIVVAYCMNYTAARQTVTDLETLGVGASLASLDVSNVDQMQALFKQVEERHGRLDIFVSNAARTTFRPAMELNAHNWQRIMDINARAFLLGSQMAANLMRQNGGGRIIGISSLGSQFAIPNYAGLGAAKAVLESLARYLAVELAPWNINVNVVCGGYVDTESMRLSPDYAQIVDYVRQRTPAGRVATADDLAGVVAFLCSPDSDWVRGQTLVADGGFSLVLGWEGR
jgi:enoyl-[acyl-carrier protein] reductase III